MLWEQRENFPQWPERLFCSWGLALPRERRFQHSTTPPGFPLSTPSGNSSSLALPFQTSSRGWKQQLPWGPGVPYLPCGFPDCAGQGLVLSCEGEGCSSSPQTFKYF